MCPLVRLIRPTVVVVLVALVLAALLHSHGTRAEPITPAAEDVQVATAEQQIDWQQYVPQQYRGYINQQSRRDGHDGGREEDDGRREAEEEEGEAEKEESSEARLRQRSRVRRERRVDEREERSVERRHGGRREKVRLRRTERETESERSEKSGHVRAHSDSREDGGSEEDEGRSKREVRHGRGGAGGRHGGSHRGAEDGRHGGSHRLADTNQATDDRAAATVAVPVAALSLTEDGGTGESSWCRWLFAVLALSVGCCVFALLIRATCLAALSECGWQQCRDRSNGYQYASIKDSVDDSEQLLL